MRWDCGCETSETRVIRARCRAAREFWNNLLRAEAWSQHYRGITGDTGEAFAAYDKHFRATPAAAAA
jgi:hypothetical protein